MIDFYLEDGRTRLMEQLGIMRDALGFERHDKGTDEPGLFNASDIQERLKNLHDGLNAVDPHFRYYFRTSPTPPELPAPGESTPDDLVLSVATWRAGDQNRPVITIDVYTRYDAALEDRPVPISFSVDASGLDEAERLEVERSVRYGTPLKAPAIDLKMDLPGGLGTNMEAAATVSMGPGLAQNAQPYRIRMRVTAPDGDLLGEVAFDMAPVTTGVAGGQRASGTSSGGVIDFELLSDPPIGSDGANHHVTFKLNDLDGLVPVKAAPEVEFLQHLITPNQLAILPEFGPSHVGMPLGASEAMVTPKLVAVVQSLALLQSQLDGDLRIPDLDETDWETTKQILGGAALLRGMKFAMTWTEWPTPILFPIKPAGPGPHEVHLAGAWNATIASRAISIDYVRIVLVAAEAEWLPEENGQHPARLTASAADQRMILMIDKELAAEILASAAGTVEPQSVADRCSE